MGLTARVVSRDTRSVGDEVDWTYVSPPELVLPSDSRELPRDRVPGTDRKLEAAASGALLTLGEDTLCGEIGRLSRDHSAELVERASVGEMPPGLAPFDCSCEVVPAWWSGALAGF